MATIMTHAVVGAAIVLSIKNGLPKPLLSIAVFYAGIAAMIPDADVVAFVAGIPYEAPLGHRGLSQSLAFAAVAGVLFSIFIFYRSRTSAVANGSLFRKFCWIFFLVIASHPLLDMLTDGGYGSAIFAPITWERYFFPVTPIPVSPIGLHWGVVRVFMWEIALVWPLVISLIVRGYADSKSVKYAAFFAAIAVTIASLWFRNHYYPFI